jgi:hypothetical protein
VYNDDNGSDEGEGDDVVGAGNKNTSFVLIKQMSFDIIKVPTVLYLQQFELHFFIKVYTLCKLSM